MNEIEEIRKKIKILEENLLKEKINKNKAILIDKINKLKNELLKYMEIKYEVKNKKSKKDNFDLIDFSENYKNDKYLLKDIKNKIYKDIQSAEIQIENCENLNLINFESENSTQLINVKNSTILCFSNQIRLIDCENINLIAFSKSGIYLQNSKKITIRPNNNYNKNYINFYNDYKNVNDFSNPLNNENYNVVDK